MPKKLTEQQRAEICRAYLTPNSDGTWNGSNVIAERYGMTAHGIMYVLHSMGVPLRSAKESHANGKRCKPVTHIPQGDPPLCACGCSQPVEWSQAKNDWPKYVQGHYHPKRPYHDRDWLICEYIEKQRTATDIAREFGVDDGTIARSMRSLGIELRTQRESLRLSGGVAKERNPAWKGGVTPARQRLYKTTKWKDLVKAVFKRDGYHCHRCHKPKTQGRKLHAHHIKSWAEYPDLRFELSNLMTLCDGCHTWVHSLENVNHDYLG